MATVCVGHNISNGDGTWEYQPVKGWNFVNPDQLEAMIAAGEIEGYEVGENRHGDRTYHVSTLGDTVDREAFNAFQYED